MGVSSVSPGGRFMLPTAICVNNINLPVLALVDSGAEQNLISHHLVEQLLIPTVSLPRDIMMGQNITSVSQKVLGLHIVISGNHHEECDSFVFPSESLQMVLGFPWLSKHNPAIDWSEGRVESWSSFCSSNCLKSAVFSFSPAKTMDEEIDLSNVPSCYPDLSTAFSKQRALSLPPHRPYDCTIDPPGAPLPSCRLYHLSGPEKETMRNYTEDSLASGIIRPSMSPVGAGFFLCF